MVGYASASIIDTFNNWLNPQFGASVLQVYQGGTGATSFSAGDCLKGNGAGAITTGACGGGGSANYNAFTHPKVGESATTSVMNLTNGFNSNASSTFVVAPSISSLTGVLKGNGLSALTVAANGTDFTLISATTCGGTDKVSAIDASGNITCSADVSGGGSANYDAFTHVVAGTSATSTELRLTGGLISTASSTFSSDLNTQLINASSTILGTTMNLYGSGVSFITGNLGLGHTVPANKLDINGSVALATSGFVGFVGNAAVTTSNYSLFGNTTLTLLNARSGASIGFRIANTDVANFTTTGGYAFGATYYNIDPGQNNLTVEGKLGAASSSPGTTLSVGGDGTGINFVDNGTSTFQKGIKVIAGGLQTSAGLTISGGNINFASGSFNALDGGGLTTTAGALAIGAGTCITVNANDVAVTSNCTDATTLDSIDSGSFLRSDATDSYTSGTLTFDAGTTVDINSTTLTIADTAIGFDGASTEFTFTGNHTINTDDLVIIKSSGLVGIATTSPGTGLSIFGDAVGINFHTGTSSFSTTGGLNLNAGCFAIRGTCVGAGGAGTPGGSDTQLQYNNAGSFGGASTLLWNGTNLSLATTTFGTLLNIGSALNVSNATSTFYSALKGGRQTLVSWTAQSGVPPNSAYAAFSTRNNHPVVTFQENPNQEILFSGILPEIYNRGSVKLRLIWGMSTTTSQSVKWDASVECIVPGTDDMDNYGHAATSTITMTSSATSGITSVAEMNGINMDGCLSGQYFRVRVARDAVTDAGTGDAEITGAYLIEQP